MANKEAVFSLRVDTGKSVSEISAFDKGLQDANKSAQNLDNTITDVNATFEQVYGELQPLTTRLGEAEDRLYELALAGDTTSQQYKELLETVSRYRRTQIETDMVVDQASKTFGEKLAGGVGTATELFSGFESATALLGVESEQLVQTMVKLQAVQGLAAAVSEIQIKIKEKDALFTGIQTAAQKTYAFAVGESTGAMKVFRTALLATGVGALIVLIGALIANFDDLKAAIFGTNEAADAMKETMDAYKQGAQGAIESTTQVGNAFELAKQGVISKEEALYTYNETLGDTFGRATNLNEAEQLYIKKKEAFIAATAARAQAQALFAKAAEESANALTAQFEDQTNILQKTAAGFTSYFFGVKAGADQLIEAQKKEVSQAEKTSKRKAKVYEDAGKAKLKEAETTENANGIISENEKKTQDAIAAKRKEAAEKAKKLREEQLKAAKEAWEKEKELSLKYAEELTKIIENRVKKEDEIIRTSQMTKAEWAAKEAERINKLREDEFKDAQGYLEAELISNQNNFEARKQLLELQREQELSNKELTEGEITAIEAKYAEQRKAIQQEERDLRIQAVQNTLTTISNLAQLFAGSSEKQQRKAFQVQKAVSIAQATIDTYKAAQAAYASLAGVPVVGPVLGAAAAAAAVSAGLLNVKNIASQKFEGGGSTGGVAAAPSIGSAGAGATAGQLGGNAANANLNTQQQNTAELIAQSNQGAPVYVLESDITGTQNKVAMQNKLSVW